MQPLISVIIPVYKVEKHLSGCIDSVLAQSYENIEILLVDDGSPDGSGVICDEYAEKDSRINVIHKKNTGVAVTRNTGIESSSGEYFCFMDSDDRIHPDYVKRMYELIKEHDADISMCAYVFSWENGDTKRSRNAEYAEDAVFTDTGADAMTKMLYSNIYAPSCFCKLFKRSSADIKFPKYAIGEDMVYVSKQLLAAGKVVMTNEALYYYLQNEAGVMHTVNPDKLYDTVLSGEAMVALLPDNNKKLADAAAYYTAEKNISVFMKLYKMNDQKDKIKHIKENIKKCRKTVIKDGNARAITKMNCLFTYPGFGFFYMFKTLRSKVG